MGKHVVAGFSPRVPSFCICKEGNTFLFNIRPTP